MLRIGILGLGYWGPNLVRVLSSLPQCEVTALCDLNVRRLKEFCDLFPSVIGSTDKSKVLTRDVVDAVVIATPTKTHYGLAKEALEEGLHTFVEKPLATSTAECEDLIELAESQDLKLFVGHVFLYSPAVVKLKEMVISGELGDVCHMRSNRLNLGPVRHDANALWDLAPHDVSIMLELLGTPPVSVSCSGLAHLNDSVHDVCTLAMHFENNRMGIVNVSWLDPHKKREMTIVGSKKMAVYNDIEPLEKIKVYNNGVEGPSYNESYGELQFSYRFGDVYSPSLGEGEPLKAECNSFVNSIVQGKRPKTDGQNGLEVVEVIEAANVSLQNGNGMIYLDRLTARAAGSQKQLLLNRLG